MAQVVVIVVILIRACIGFVLGCIGLAAFGHGLMMLAIIIGQADFSTSLRGVLWSAVLPLGAGSVLLLGAWRLPRP
jgi:hypothetical protein